MRTVFICLIVIISIVGGFNSISSGITVNNALALIVSVIGILGAFLYYKGNRLSKPLFYIWAIAQIPDFYKITTISTDDSILATQTRTNILSLYQFFKFSLGMTLKFTSGANYFFFNFLGLAYFPVIYWLELEKFVGKSFNILKFHEFEVKSLYKANIVKRVTVSKEKDWYIIALDKDITFDDYSTKDFMITPQDENSILLLEGKAESIKAFACPPNLSLDKSNYSIQDIEYIGLIDIIGNK